MLSSEYIRSIISCWQTIEISSLDEAARVVRKKISMGNNIFVVGNGGSSSTASHFVNDWSKILKGKVFSLTDNVPMLTALANDISYDEIFSYQIRNLAMPEDLLVAISGSGNSENVIRACIEAKKLGMTIVTLTGFDGGKLKSLGSFSFHCPINDMQIVEDLHLSFGHIVVRCQ